MCYLYHCHYWRQITLRTKLSPDQVRGLEEHQVAQGSREAAQLTQEDEGVRRRKQRNVQAEEDAGAARRPTNEGDKRQFRL